VVASPRVALTQRRLSCRVATAAEREALDVRAGRGVGNTKNEDPSSAKRPVLRSAARRVRTFHSGWESTSAHACPIGTR